MKPVISHDVGGAIVDATADWAPPLLPVLREAFDGNDVPAKNIALRKAYDAIDRLTTALAAREAERDQWKRSYEAAWDQVRTLAALEAENIELKVMLLDLLAVIHRDGGHKTQAIGRKLAWEQAMQLSSERIARLDEREAENEALRASRADEWNAYMDEAVANSPKPLQELGAWLAAALDEDKWKTAERYLNAAALLSRTGGTGV